jgi:hypothetical protein
MEVYYFDKKCRVKFKKDKIVLQRKKNIFWKNICEHSFITTEKTTENDIYNAYSHLFWLEGKGYKNYLDVVTENTKVGHITFQRVGLMCFTRRFITI